MTTKNTESQASFLQTFSSPVNPRTGNVEARFLLASINSGLQDPIVFELALTSTRLSSDVQQLALGFGNRWLPSTPRIERKNKTIYFCNGEVATFVGDPAADVTLNYHKQTDVNIEIINDGTTFNGWVATHKSGTVEYYNENGNILKAVSASGNYLDFSSDIDYNDSYITRLNSVTDGNGNRIDITYGDPSPESTITITQTIEGEVRSTQVVLESQSNNLLSVSLPGNTSALNTFTYKSVGGVVVLRSIGTPMGQLQIFTYGYLISQKSIDVPPVSSTTPVVVLLEIRSTEDSDPTRTIINYGYGSTKASDPIGIIDADNFTGYSTTNPIINPVDNTDNCILRTDPFTYYVTEIHRDIKTKRTYNRFHLLTSEEVINISDSKTVLVTTYDYSSIVADNGIDGQPGNFSFWTTKATSYTNPDAAGDDTAVRSIIDEREVDKYGNVTLLREKLEQTKTAGEVTTTTARGILTQNTYYPANSTEGCPATIKSFFVSYLKESITSPEASGCHADTVKKVGYTYSAVTGNDYTPPFTYTGKERPSMALPWITKTNDIETFIATYIAATDDPAPDKTYYAGKIKTLSMGSADNKKNHNISYYYTTINDSSTPTINLVFIEETHTSTDASVTPAVESLKKFASAVFSLASGLKRREVGFKDSHDDASARTDYGYDAEYRLRERKYYVRSSPDVSQSESYQYRYFTKVGVGEAPLFSQNTVVVKSSTGLYTTQYINFRSQVSQKLEYLSGTDHIVSNYYYDENSIEGPGLLTGEDRPDIIKKEAPSGESDTIKEISPTTKYEYYAREVTQITKPDGLVQHFKRDNVLNTETYTENENVSSIKTTYNNFGHILNVERIFSDSSFTPCTLEAYQYDGLGRKTLFKNKQSGRTEYTYDNFDRLTSERVLFSATDATYTETTYKYEDSAQNNYKLVTSLVNSDLAANKIIVAKKTYDGFGRLTRQTNNNLTDGTIEAVVDDRIFTYTKSSFNQPTGVSSTNHPSDIITTTYNPYTQAVKSTEHITQDVITTKYDYTYDKSTGLTATGTASYKVSGRDSYTQGSNFSYTYDDRGELTATTMLYGIDALTVNTAKTLSRSGSYLLSATNHLGETNNQQRYYYDDQGRLTTKVYADIDLRIAGTYNSNGALINIQITSATFTTASQAGNIMGTTELVYNDEFLTRRNLKIIRAGDVSPTLVYSCATVYDQKGSIGQVSHYKEAEADYAPLLVNTYTYEEAYGSLSTSKTEMFTTSSTVPDYENTRTYTYKGGLRLDNIDNSNQHPISNTSYTYTGDRLSSYQYDTTPEDFSSDSYGNITSASRSIIDPTASVNYKFELGNRLYSAQYTDTYRYRYEPSGLLSKIEKTIDDTIYSITYIYDGDVVIGEISDTTKTLYLSFNDIIIGRYKFDTSTNTKSVELYGSDCAGSVRCLATFAEGGTVTGPVYYNYQDGGERSIWS